MTLDYQPILAFPGVGILEDILGGAAANITDDIFSSITGWILTSAFAIFGFAVEIAFSNDSIAAGCNANNIGGCSRASFISETFQQSLAVSASIAAIGFIFSIIKAILHGDPGEVARRAFFETPRILFISVFLLQGTMILMLATDEMAALLSHPSIGPDRDNYLGSFSVEELQTAGVDAPSFVIAGLGVMLIIGSAFIWMLMMIRSVGIAVLVVFAPLVAALAVGGKNQMLNKLLQLLFTVITSKALIMVVLSLGIATILQVPFIQAGLDPDAVVAAPPIEPGGADDGVELGEALAANFQTAYQLATGAMLVFAAAFSPVVILQLLPDSVESYYAMGRVERQMTGARHSIGSRVASRVPGVNYRGSAAARTTRLAQRPGRP